LHSYNYLVYTKIRGAEIFTAETMSDLAIKWPKGKVM